MESKKDFNGLSKALAYRKDPKIVSAAAIALRRIGDDSALKVLASALKENNNDSNVRTIAEALAQSNGVRLTELVKNSQELPSHGGGELQEESLTSEALDKFVARMRDGNEKSENSSHKDE